MFKNFFRKKSRLPFRIGHGYDVHELCTDRFLIIGGVSIPYKYGLLGHSDADVLTHAVIDSLLGALALGDIGVHFPDSDEQYKDISSLYLLGEIMKKVSAAGYTVGNIDCTILCEKPKLKGYIPLMRENIAAVLGIDSAQASVKATTEESLGFTGREEGIAAHCVCLLYSNYR